MRKQVNTLILLGSLAMTTAFGADNLNPKELPYCDLGELEYLSAKNQLTNDYICPDFVNDQINISENVFELGSDGKVAPVKAGMQATEYNRLREKVCDVDNYPSETQFLELTEEEVQRVTQFAQELKGAVSPAFTAMERQISAVPHKVNELLKLQELENVEGDTYFQSSYIKENYVELPQYVSEEDLPLKLRTDGQYFSSNRHDEIIVRGFCDAPADTNTYERLKPLTSCIQNSEGKYSVDLSKESLAFFFHDRLQVQEYVTNLRRNSRYQRRQSALQQYITRASNPRNSEIVNAIKRISGQGGGVVRNLNLKDIKSFCSVAPIVKESREPNEAVLSMVRKYIDLKEKGKRLKNWFGNDKIQVVAELSPEIEDYKGEGFGSCKPKRGASLLTYDLNTNVKSGLFKAPLKLPEVSTQNILNLSAVLDIFHRVGNLLDSSDQRLKDAHKIFQALYNNINRGVLSLGFQVKHEDILAQLKSLGFNTEKMVNGQKVDKTPADIVEEINYAFFNVLPYSCQPFDVELKPDLKINMGLYGTTSMEAAKRIFFMTMLMLKLEDVNYEHFSRLYSASISDVLTGDIFQSTSKKQFLNVPFMNEYTSRDLGIDARQQYESMTIDQLDQSARHTFGNESLRVSKYDYLNSPGATGVGSVLSLLKGNQKDTPIHSTHTNIYNKGLRISVVPHIFMAKAQGDTSKHLGTYVSLFDPKFVPPDSRVATSALNCFSVADAYVYLSNNPQEENGLINSDYFYAFKNFNDYAELDIRGGSVNKSKLKFIHTPRELESMVQRHEYKEYFAFYDAVRNEKRSGFIEGTQGAGVAFKGGSTGNNWRYLPSPMQIIDKERELFNTENAHLSQFRRAYWYVEKHFRTDRKPLYHYISSFLNYSVQDHNNYVSVNSSNDISPMPAFFNGAIKDYYQLRVYLKDYYNNRNRDKKTEKDFLLFGETKSPHSYLLANCSQCNCVKNKESFVNSLKEATLINFFDEYEKGNVPGFDVEVFHKQREIEYSASLAKDKCIFTPLVPHTDFISNRSTSRLLASMTSQKVTPFKSCKQITYLKQRYETIKNSNNANKAELINEDDAKALARKIQCRDLNLSIAHVSAENLNKNNSERRCAPIEGIR